MRVQTVFYIPYTGRDDQEVIGNVPPLLSSPYQEHDLPGGDQLRLEAYQEAWTKCSGRVQTVMHGLYIPVVAAIVEQIHSSYSDILSGLPYPELPVICITNPASGSALLSEITTQIDSSDLETELLFNASSFTAHLHTIDCVNLTTAMKALVAGFVERPHILESVKSRPAMTLANYDINWLEAWYTALQEVYETQPKLVVLLHDFEQLDPIVVQDLFYICSLHIPRLPLIFVLSLSSPPSPSYLHTAYPRSTLTLLRVFNFTVPSGTKIIEEVLLKTFFDIEFEPDIMIGPVVLAFVKDYFTRHSVSLDSALTILQLAHLKHFSIEPLTLLVQSTHGIITEPSSRFNNTLLTRLQCSRIPSPINVTDERTQPSQALRVLVDNARAEFYTRARKLRIGFGIIRLVQDFMRKNGYKGLDWDRYSGSMLDVMADLMRGKLGPSVQFLGSLVRKLRTTQFGTLLDQLRAYFHSMPSEIRFGEEEAQAKLISSINALPEKIDNDISGIGAQLAESFGKWLVEYLNGLLTPLENAMLWGIWYTGLSPFPSELINPSIRASVLSGLLRPHAFAASMGPDNNKEPDRSLWELPDTSILLQRYLDSGKMINVYDWFESFHLVLDAQRNHLKKVRTVDVTSHKDSSRQTGRERKGKAKAEQNQPVDILQEDQEEKWEFEIQARFMRALQELDYLGFIKHTGRKADHVLRTVFDMHD